MVRAEGLGCNQAAGTLPYSARYGAGVGVSAARCVVSAARQPDSAYELCLQSYSLRSECFRLSFIATGDGAPGAPRQHVGEPGERHGKCHGHRPMRNVGSLLDSRTSIEDW